MPGDAESIANWDVFTKGRGIDSKNVGSGIVAYTRRAGREINSRGEASISRKGHGRGGSTHCDIGKIESPGCFDL